MENQADSKSATTTGWLDGGLATTASVRLFAVDDREAQESDLRSVIHFGSSRSVDDNFDAAADDVQQSVILTGSTTVYIARLNDSRLAHEKPEVAHTRQRHTFVCTPDFIW